jgi:hypothetical protein
MQDEKKTASSADTRSAIRSRGRKALAFALMLTVPVALSGCNQTSALEECEDDDLNDYCDDDGSGTYVSHGKTYKKSSSYKSATGSSKGFGSSGISIGSGG